MFSEEIEYGKFCFLMRSAVFRDKIFSKQSTSLVHLYGPISNSHSLSLHPLIVPMKPYAMEQIPLRTFSII